MEGETRRDFAKVFDFDNPENNDFLVVNQFTVVSGEHNLRPDVVVFVNGLPLEVIEVKNPATNERPVEAFRKNITPYKKEILKSFITMRL
ncbi:MAG: type I restriction endonuclease [Candidatus Nanoarchaeia archaeon]|nr:type I restriction endonuclease [Candidatus Jingweiarchaeum tengchongense]